MCSRKRRLSTAAVAIAAIHLFPGVADVYRMTVFDSCQRYASVVLAELLSEDHMTCIAISGKDFPVITHVFSVVTTETTG